MTEVKQCKCNHEFQDKQYGKNSRLHNKTTKGYRCTVCGSEKSASK